MKKNKKNLIEILEEIKPHWNGAEILLQIIKRNILPDNILENLTQKISNGIHSIQTKKQKQKMISIQKKRTRIKEIEQLEESNNNVDDILTLI